MGVWEGYAELQEALRGLAGSKGTSAKRVKVVANAAFKYVKVQSCERRGVVCMCRKQVCECVCARVTDR